MSLALFFSLSGQAAPAANWVQELAAKWEKGDATTLDYARSWELEKLVALENEVGRRLVAEASKSSPRWEQVDRLLHALTEVTPILTRKAESQNQPRPLPLPALARALLKRIRANEDQPNFEAYHYLTLIDEPLIAERMHRTADETHSPAARAFARYVLYRDDPTPGRLDTLLETIHRLEPASVERSKIVQGLLSVYPPDPKLLALFAEQMVSGPDPYHVGEILSRFRNESPPQIFSAALKRLDIQGSQPAAPRAITDFGESRLKYELREFMERIPLAVARTPEFQNAARPYLRSRSSLAAFHAQEVFDRANTARPTYADQSAMVRAEAPLPAQTGNVCQSLCRIADGVAEWLKPEYQAKADFADSDNPNATWRFAINSLAALFLAKAAPFCPRAESITSQMIGRWLDPTLLARTIDQARTTAKNESGDEAEIEKVLASLQSELDPKAKANLGTFREQIKGSQDGGRPLHATAVYSAMFYNLWLREIIAQGKLAPDAQAIATESQTNSEKILKEMTSFFKEARKESKAGETGPYRLSGSLFSTYLSATSLLALERPAVRQINEVKKSIPDPDRPLLVTYFPFLQAGDSLEDKSSADHLRGGVGRAVPVYLLLYRTAPSPQARAIYRGHLIAALENFAALADVLALHSQRDGTHIEPSGLAPYYYSGNLPYAASAWKFLSEETDLSADEQTRLNRIGPELERAALLAIDERGLARPHGKSHYASSDAYVNPLVGLSLVALAKDCRPLADQPPVRTHGIVDSHFLPQPDKTLGDFVDEHSDTLKLTGAYTALVATVLLAQKYAPAVVQKVVASCRLSLARFKGEAKDSRPNHAPPQ